MNTNTNEGDLRSRTRDREQEENAVTIRIPKLGAEIYDFLRELGYALRTGKQPMFKDSDGGDLDPRQLRNRKRRRGVVLVKIPRTSRGFDNFIRKVVDSQYEGKQVEFDATAYIRPSYVDEVVDSFILMMMAGNLPPWAHPWSDGRPRNAYGALYRGINAFNLAWISELQEYHSPIWLTRERARKLGHPVRKGERGTRLVGRWRGFDDPNPEVFNRMQCEDIEDMDVKQAPLPSAQKVIDRYLRREKRLGLSLGHSRTKNRAYYNHVDDHIVMPTKNRFPVQARYYMTAFHEMAHSTGHYKRRDRRKDGVPYNFGSHAYGTEELVAEMTAALLAGETDVTFKDPIQEQSASYLEGWLDAIGDDYSMLSIAADEAQKAVDYITDYQGTRKKARKRADERERDRKAKERKRARAKK